ncbi:alpha/beta hydrolase [Allokutzneria multivorans]|uniref:Alpha/beta hydrolase n=1 Tax=Allokutzneria multivorans TaxID=1142134 RepID=A0ABP7SZP2_9PSEU
MPVVERRWTALCALSAVLLAGCTATSPNNQAQVQPRVEQRGPAGPVPAGLERYYAQKLTWESCDGYAVSSEQREAFQRRTVECARMTVPLDYARPGARDITLGLLRRPATEKDKRIGSVVINPGGPGASGMAAAAGMSGQVRDNDLGKRFDLVGFDPRGVGASQPEVRCLTDAERDELRLDTDLDYSPAGVAASEAEEKDYATKCASRTGTDVLANIGSREVAKDLDVMRSALGDEKLTYIGYSYGTRIGTVYAENFPGNVRAMVLDGAVDPDQDPNNELIAQGAGFQKAFDAFSRWCAQRFDCALGTDATQTAKVFQRLVRPLAEKPIALKDGRKLSYGDAVTAVIQTLYSETQWEGLNSGLNQLSKGGGEVLMSLADNYNGRGSDGRYSNINDAFSAVRCVDDARTSDRAVRADVERRYRQAAPFLDDGSPVVGYLDACAFWPAPVSAQPLRADLPGLPQLLVVSTTGDPATPHEAGIKLARVLRARLLTQDATRHTGFLSGNPCVDAAGIAYLVDLKVPAEGARCAG